MWVCGSLEQVYALNQFYSINTGGGLITNTQFASEASIGQWHGVGLHNYSATTYIHHSGFIQSADTNVFSTYLLPASVLNVVASVGSNGSGVQLSWTVSANNSLQAAGPLAFSGTTNSPFTTYRIYYERSDMSSLWPSSTSAYFDLTVYADLGNFSTTNVVLTSLAAGFDYRIAVAGVNSLGLVGPLVNIQEVVSIPPSFARTSVSVNHGGGYATNAMYASVGAVGQGQGLGMHMACAYIHSAGFVQTYQPGDLVEFTRPAGVLNITAANDEEDVIDNSSEVLLNWAVTAGSASWAAGPLACIDTELPPFTSYRIYYTLSDSSNRWPSVEDSYIEMMDGFAGLGDFTTTNVLLTGLTPGTDYRMAIAGVNNAGTVGPLSNAQAMVRTSMFDITNAYVSAGNGVTLEWAGPANGMYDVIYADAKGFENALNSAWRLADTVQSNRFVDTGDATNGRDPPGALTNGMMRFYRVAPMNAWVPSDDRDGIASSNVVAVKNLSLIRGHNMVSLGLEPFSSTMAGVFGTNRLPASANYSSTASNTTIYIWRNSANFDAIPHWFNLRSSAGWFNELGDMVSNSNAPIPETISIMVPSPTNLLLVGRAAGFPATNEMVFMVATGELSTITLRFPFPVKMRDLPGLRSTNVQSHTLITRADRIFILNETVSPPVAKYIIFRRNDGNFYYSSGASAENHEIQPFEAVVFRPYPLTTANTPGRPSPVRVDFTPTASVMSQVPEPTTRLTNNLIARPTVNRPAVSMAGYSATITARINPHSIATTYWFRHGETADDAISSPAFELPHLNNSFQTVTKTYDNLQGGKGHFFEVVASNGMGVGRASVMVPVGCPSIFITNGLLPALTNFATGEASNYQVQLVATGGEAPYTYEIISGGLPQGLSLGANGFISGSGSGPSRSFSVRVTDRNGCTGVWQGMIEGESHIVKLLASDSFKYPPGAPLTGQSGGSGWSGGWTPSTGQVGQWSVASMNLAGAFGYPNAGGHSTLITGLAPGSFSFAQRVLSPPVSTGTLFVAALVKYQHSIPSCHAGLSLHDGALRVAYFGKNYSNNSFGIETSGINQASDITMDAGTVNLIILRYDFSTRTLKGHLVHPNMTVGAEPGNWHVTINNVNIGRIDGIRLVAGGANSPGEVFYDELRIATSWTGLMGQQ